MLALNDTSGDSPNATPTPQQVIDAVGSALRIEAGGIFLMRGSDMTPIALHFRTQRLRDAFVQAYQEKAVGLDTVQQMQPIGQAIKLADWASSTHLPPYVLRLLSLDAWVMALNLTQEDEVVGLLWMIGSAKPANGPPGPSASQMIAQLAVQAVQATAGRGWALQDTEEMRLLDEVSTILAQQRPLQERLNIVVQRTQEATGFASVELHAYRTANQEHSSLYAIALDESSFDKDYQDWAGEYNASEEVVSQASQYSKGREGPLLFPNPAKLSTIEEPYRRWLLDNDVTFQVQIPLVYDEEHLGSLRICSSFSEEQTWNRLRVFTLLASHIAAILRSAILFDQVQEAHASLTASHHATVRTLAHAAEARDPYTGDHLKHIEAYVRVLTPRLGFSPAETEEISFGAILHDVGKLRVPDSILLKPGKLDAEEWEVIRKHPLYGEEILIHSNIPHVALEIARWHHERWDGGGYPDGLSGSDIPLAVRITSVADVYDALTSLRPYKAAWPADQALAEILKHRGSQFAPDAVDAFAALHDEGVIDSILSNHAEDTPIDAEQNAAA